MKTNLLVRFIIIICVALVAGWMAKTPPRLGIDLAGGTSLLYELDLSKAPPGAGADLAAQVVEVLKKRVDPLGSKNMIWRVVEGKRIQIQMPYPSQAVRDAKTTREKAEKALREILWQQPEVAAVARQAGDAPVDNRKVWGLFPAVARSSRAAADPLSRQAILEKFIAERMAVPAGQSAADKAELDKARANALAKLEALTDADRTLAAVNEKFVGVRPADYKARDLLDKQAAELAYGDALEATKSLSVDLNYLNTLMKNADTYSNHEAQDELAGVPARFPLQKDRIQALVNAHKAEITLTGGGVDSPEELQRLVTQAGVLDFRIAVLPNEITSADLQDARDSLKKYGPEQQVRAAGTTARWFGIQPNGKDNLTSGGYVNAKWAQDDYLLCYDDHDHALTHSDPKRQSWRVSAGKPNENPSDGGIYLPFSLDAIGGNYMGDLTGNNLKRPMAILLDDKAMTAPTIQSRISDNGQITFGASTSAHPKEEKLKEANDLKQIMDAGSLPATLQPEPISVENISPDMGADNISAGVNSAYIAVAAVVVFMMFYYTITGVFADLALMLNLVLVLASMALLQQTFTLPGIAGLVLTLGMAVDANVLINERIREEIHRGASLWMAIKQGYDKVFWTIFDANLTTSLTSIVLILVGSEEVKGFGVTLLIGLCIHMFTALYVTRTMMQAAVKWGILKAIDDHSVAEYLREIVTLTWLRRGHFPFMRVITVTKIDWIGMRKKFWVVSAIITVAGLVAFVARGEDKYDIEFRGGTQVTFQIKDPMADVVAGLTSLSAEAEVVRAHPSMKDLEEKFAQVESLDKRNQLVRQLADELARDPVLSASHPIIGRFPDMIKNAGTSLSLDAVRARVEGMHLTPGLEELANARVYQSGNAADRRFKVETTMANAPQNLEATLPKPLESLNRYIYGPKITHDSTATQVVMTLVKQADGSYLSVEELQKKLAALAADNPDLKDLINVEVQPTGKPDLHLVSAAIPNRSIRVKLLEPLAREFQAELASKPRLAMNNSKLEDPMPLLDNLAGGSAAQGTAIIEPISKDSRKARLDLVFGRSNRFQNLQPLDLSKYVKGVAILLDNLDPVRENDEQIYARIANIRRSSEFSNVPNREFAVIPLKVIDSNGKVVDANLQGADHRPVVRAVVVAVDPTHGYEEGDSDKITQWRLTVVSSEWKILRKALAMEDLFEGVTSFDAVVAGQAKIQALLAIVISLFLIVVYVWVRFGGIRYGLGAILSLAHDAIVALAGTVLAGEAYNHLFGHKSFLLITDFKINLTMIAAYLTVIGYSVNDTIVIFDRVREMRGKSHVPLTPKLINDAINQCFGRTIWTTFTVFIVVMIMYIWGGDGVRGFSFAMLIGVITGAYSTLAIASPMLLATGAGKAGPRGPSPFIRKDAPSRPQRVPELPEETDGGDELEGEPEAEPT